MTTTAATFEHQGQTYEIRRVQIQRTINELGGAAPWLIGNKYTDIEHRLYLGEEYIMNCPFNRKHPDMSIRQIKQSLTA